MTTFHRLFASASAVMFLAGASACGDSSGPSAVAQTVTVAFTGPNATEGALSLTVEGPGLANAIALPAQPSYRVFSRLESPTRLRILILGNLIPGPVATFSAVIRNPDQLAGTVVEVADTQNLVRSSIASHTLVLSATK